MGIDNRNIDDALPDSAGHMQTKKKNGDKIKKRRPDDGLPRRQDPGRDNSGYGVCRIMKAVKKIKGQRQGDQKILSSTPLLPLFNHNSCNDISHILAFIQHGFRIHENILPFNDLKRVEAIMKKFAENRIPQLIALIF